MKGLQQLRLPTASSFGGEEKQVSVSKKNLATDKVTHHNNNVVAPTSLNKPTKPPVSLSFPSSCGSSSSAVKRTKPSQKKKKKQTIPQQEKTKSCTSSDKANRLQSFKQNLQRGLAKAASVGQRRLATKRRLANEQRDSENTTSSSNDSESCSQIAKSTIAPVVASSDEKSNHNGNISSSSGTRTSLSNVPDAVAEWQKSLDALLQSDEMRVLQQHTLRLGASLHRAALEAALFPLTIVLSTEERNRLRSMPNNETNVLAPRSAHPMEHAWNVPGQAIEFAAHVACQVVADLWSVLAVPTPQQPRRRLVLQKDPDAWQDRLKLTTHEGGNENMGEEETHRRSQFLLRLGDLSVRHSFGEDEDEESIGKAEYTEHPQQQILLLDLQQSEEYRLDEVLLEMALGQLVLTGLRLLSTHPTVCLRNPQYNVSSPEMTAVKWKCEAGTARLLRRMVDQTAAEKLQTLQSSDALIWSGRMQLDNPSAVYGGQFPIYMARGMLPLAPLDLLQLLWENKRTSEYNRHCLERKTLVELRPDNSILDGCGTKVIESKTKVPFTSFTVQVQCLMHSRPLDGDHDQGYVLISRSLCQGSAGVTCVGNPNKAVAATPTSGNEIVWGINVLRQVPGHPGWTDLTSLSQVGYSLAVPQFLASQIALRGVQEFYQNVRRMRPKQDQ